jgi:glutamyl-tRNA(Gln) amidotransferase subunit D
MKPDIVDALVDRGYRGIVIAGTGLGHVNRLIYPALERAHAAGVQLYMTLQTLWGFVQMHVYETGREILELGVVPLANMLPEVAYIKLGWALGVHPDDPAVRRLMVTTIAGRDDGARAARRLSHPAGRPAGGAGVSRQGLALAPTGRR